MVPNDASTRRAWPRLIAIVAILVAVAFGVRFVVRELTGGPSLFKPELAEEFLDRYVQDDGRVVRSDQGSDTVSEGQAYAMLLAVALGDEERFGRVWDWTRRMLQRPDGLLSWHWSGDRVTDAQSASDADIDAAYALLLAGERFGDDSYTREARRIAGAVLEIETAEFGQGRVLVAGPWAREQRVVNPSYVFPLAFRRFADAFGEEGWNAVLSGSVAVVERVTSGGSSWPPDWAHVTPDGDVTEGRPPGVEGPPAEGLDAARVPLRFASSCGDEARGLASMLWRNVGERTGGDAHPANIVGAAAAAHAAGDTRSRDELLARAEEVVRARPTYYGWALVALGPALLDGDALRSCPGALG